MSCCERGWASDCVCENLGWTRLIRSVSTDRHDTGALPDGPDRRPVGAGPAVPPGPQVRGPQRRPAGHRHPRGAQRRLLPPAGRRGVAAVAPRLPALVHRLHPVPPVAGCRGVGRDPRPHPGGGPGRGRAPAGPAHRADRQPDGEDDPPGRGPGVRRGEKRSTAASGSSSPTRSG